MPGNNSIFSADTSLYCIFGNPVSHSKSPIMHNTLFKNYNINSVYLSFNINNIEKAIESIRELNIKGASITIPFKQKVMKHLDIIDKQAESIGAVNTIVNNNGILTGYNTDWQGGVSPLKKYGINDKKVGIIGAGGAAHALAHGIKINKGYITIINRTRERGEKLAELFNADFCRLDQIKEKKFDILINATSLGMTPDIDTSPAEKQLLKKNMIIMDIVYNPIETKFIKDAKKIGCTTIDGLSMFLHQGINQFELWTKIKPSMDNLRQTIMRSLI